MACTVISQSATRLVVHITEPTTQAAYLFASTIEKDPGATTVCYTVENISPPGIQASGISHVDIGLCPEEICSGAGDTFTHCCLTNVQAPIIYDGDGIPCPPAPAPGDCLEYPVPIATDAGQICGFRVNLHPPVEIGESRTVCVSFVGCFETTMVPFRMKTGAGVVSNDATSVVYGLSCIPCQAELRVETATATSTTTTSTTTTPPPRGLGWPMSEVQVDL